MLFEEFRPERPTASTAASTTRRVLDLAEPLGVADTLADAERWLGRLDALRRESRAPGADQRAAAAEQLAAGRTTTAKAAGAFTAAVADKHQQAAERQAREAAEQTAAGHAWRAVVEATPSLLDALAGVVAALARDAVDLGAQVTDDVGSADDAIRRGPQIAGAWAELVGTHERWQNVVLLVRDLVSSEAHPLGLAPKALLHFRPRAADFLLAAPERTSRAALRHVPAPRQLEHLATVGAQPGIYVDGWRRRYRAEVLGQVDQGPTAA